MAMEWMDVARYADSHGLHADGWRLMWPWRDWVIHAFNSNLPFDEFITWQLAGDLLDNPTKEQILATGLLRYSIRGTDYVLEITEMIRHNQVYFDELMVKPKTI